MHKNYCTEEEAIRIVRIVENRKTSEKCYMIFFRIDKFL
jgi:hypothetical protein